jgi:hypothetical protein
MKRWLLGFLAVTGVAACGGRYEDPGPGPGAPAGSSTSAPSGGKSGPASGSTVTLPSHDLGVCTPGFERATNPQRTCNWLSESGQCFDTKDAACACICPGNKDSVCWSSFDDGPGSATLVQCA